MTKKKRQRCKVREKLEIVQLLTLPSTFGFTYYLVTEDDSNTINSSFIL